jgi:hypothetical protein
LFLFFIFWPPQSKVLKITLFVEVLWQQQLLSIGKKSSPLIPSSFQALQDLVEVAMCLKFSVEKNQGYPVEMSSGPLTDKLSQYANILAAQGALVAASTYLVRQ